MKTLLILICTAVIAVADGMYIPDNMGGGTYTDFDTGGMTIYSPLPNGGFTVMEID